MLTDGTQNRIFIVRFQVLTAATMKMAGFWVVEVLAASTSETSVNFYRAKRRYSPEDSRLQDMNFLTTNIFEIHF
jgi:hypothetical protein